jgi:hypothetical protein
MAQLLTAEEQLQGHALSSFGASMCQSYRRLHGEPKRGQRRTAAAKAVLRW